MIQQHDSVIHHEIFPGIQQHDGIIHDEIFPGNLCRLQRIINQPQLSPQKQSENLRSSSRVSKGTTAMFQYHLLYHAPFENEFYLPNDEI
jgi:hypothetical protein